MRNKHNKLLFVSCVMLLILPFAMAKLDENVSVPPDKTTIFKGKLNYSTDDVALNFTEDIESKDYDKLQLKKGVTSTKNMIKVDTLIYPELNKPAWVTFLNTGISHPLFLHNGIHVKVDFFDVGNFSFKALFDHFSSWTVVNTTWTGNFTNTSVYNNSLTKSDDAFFILLADTNATNNTDSAVTNTSGIYVPPIVYREFGGRDDKGAYVFNDTRVMVTMNRTHKPSLTGMNRFSVSLWMKRSYTINRSGLAYVIMGTGQGNPAAQSGYDMYIDDRPSVSGMTNGLVTEVDVSQGDIAIACFNNTINDSQWKHVVWTYDSNKTAPFPTIAASHFDLYIDGINRNETRVVTTSTCASTFGGNGTIVDNIQNLTFGGVEPSSFPFNGTIDDISYYDRVLNQSEIQELYNQKAYKYQRMGQYTERFNATDFNGEVASFNMWRNISFSGNCSQMTLQARSGVCAQLGSVAYTTFGINESSCISTFGESLQGGCVEIKVVSDNNYNLSYYLRNKTINADQYLRPFVADINISPQNPTQQNIIYGNVTFRLNDTDAGGFNVSWFVLRSSSVSLVKQQIITNIRNGTQVLFNLNSSDFQTAPSDVVWYQITANNTYILGDVNASSNLSIIDADTQAGSGAASSGGGGGVAEKIKPVTVVDLAIKEQQKVILADKNESGIDKIPSVTSSGVLWTLLIIGVVLVIIWGIE